MKRRVEWAIILLAGVLVGYGLSRLLEMFLPQWIAYLVYLIIAVWWTWTAIKYARVMRIFQR